MMYKKIYLLCIATLFFSLISTSAVYAEEDEGVTDVDDTEEFNIEIPNMGIYKSENPFYQIETLDYSEVAEIQKEMEEEEEDKGFFGTIGDGVTGAVMFFPNLFSDTTEDVKNNIKDNMLYIMNGIVGMIMTIIQIEAELVLGIYNFANDAEIMNYLLSQIESVIQSVAGIDSSGAIMSDTGVFGNLLGITIAISILFMTILFTVKRAQAEALKALIAPIISLTFAMILISNMSSILSTTNDITVSLMNNITQIGKENFFDEAETEIETTEDILHHTMVYKPYMLMQYGSYDEEVVAVDRSKELLTTTNNSDRKTLIEEEMTEHGNAMVSPGSIWVKVAYGAFTLFCNLLISIPILVIAGLFLVIQFAIILIVFIAPFALIWAMLPNQLAVLKKYLSTLFAPFLFKLLISIFVMIITTILAIIFSMSSANGIVGYGVSMFIMAMVMIAMYLLKNRIMSIFTVTPEGKQLANAVNKGDGAVNATKKGTGMLVGAATGGLSTIATREVMNRVANRSSNSDDAKNSNKLSDLNANRKNTGDLKGRNDIKSNVAGNVKNLSDLKNGKNSKANNQEKNINTSKDNKQKDNTSTTEKSKNNQNQELHDLNSIKEQRSARKNNSTDNDSKDKNSNSEQQELQNLKGDKEAKGNLEKPNIDNNKQGSTQQELHDLKGGKEAKEKQEKPNVDKNRQGSPQQELHDLKGAKEEKGNRENPSNNDNKQSSNQEGLHNLNNSNDKSEKNLNKNTEKKLPNDLSVSEEIKDRDKNSASSTNFNKVNRSSENNSTEAAKPNKFENEKKSNINTESRKNSSSNNDNQPNIVQPHNENYEATKPNTQESKSEKMNDRDEKSSRGGVDE